MIFEQVGYKLQRFDDSLHDVAETCWAFARKCRSEAGCFAIMPGNLEHFATVLSFSSNPEYTSFNWWSETVYRLKPIRSVPIRSTLAHRAYYRRHHREPERDGTTPHREQGHGWR